MNVTFVPAQTVPAGDAAILTLTVGAVVTAIVTVLDLTGVVEAQVAFDVNRTLICAPLVNALEE